jgi:FecR protein
MEHIMADFTRIEELTWKKLLGEITPAEENEQQTLAKASAENRDCMDRMLSNAFREKLRTLRGINYRKVDRLMKQKMQATPDVFDWIPATTRLKRIARPILTAACILAAVAGLSIWAAHKSRDKETILHSSIEATLSWSSPADNKIVLGDMPEGKAYKAGQIRIARMGNEFFIYQRPDTTTGLAGNIHYGLDVTGTEDVQVFFPDATRAQISPNSGIHFLGFVTTTLQERGMYGYGQVLFNVSHHYESPWTLQSPKLEIAVLGTKFLLRDYKQEDTAAMSCFNGKVMVKIPNKTQVITTAQRVTVDPKLGLIVSTGDLPQVEWSSPELFFDFSDLGLDSAMKEIARWYSIDTVSYHTQLDRKKPGTVFVGPISRYISLPQLLSILDRNDLHFSIQGQTILVSDK